MRQLWPVDRVAADERLQGAEGDGARGLVLPGVHAILRAQWQMRLDAENVLMK